MNTLTLIIFECDGFDTQATARSVPFADKVIVMKERDLRGLKVETDWFGFLMANELMEEPLARAIPIFLESTYECLVLFKITGKVGYATPRFFRRNIEFESEMLYPGILDTGKVNITRVLNGLIVDAPNGSK